MPLDIFGLVVKYALYAYFQKYTFLLFFNSG